ncbi:hypothetical protein SAMN04488073_0927 [Marinobacter gudaonensis]|uniref:Glycosyltransferase RgtA/B/C/D-like domain-containing protein n=1 Tax=Marinobacter gudaonensis TaxID=375760 RepID=A0A1I6GIY6_9GAMM|nr:hypothetical protein SAMN04488073_0927 [Marinobacter gudaonensis]
MLLFAASLKVYFGQDAYVEIHDNLDSSHAWLATLHQHDLFFSGGEEEVPMLSGMERDYFMSELQLGNLIYHLFSPFDAHVLNFIIKLCIGFLSFLLLAREIFGKTARYQVVVPLVSAAYALLPGYENLFIAQASLPLIVFLYIRYLRSPAPWVLLTILVYPVLSEFPRYGIFLCGLLGAVFIYFLFFDRLMAQRTLLALVVLAIGYIVTDYRVFRLMLLSDEVTIRADFAIAPGDFWKLVKDGFLYNQYHAQSKHLYVILPVAAVGFIALLDFQAFSRGFFQGVKESAKGFELRIYLALAFVICVFSLVHALYNGTEYKHFLQTIIPPLSGFNFSRFIWLNPLAWHLIFVVSLVAIGRRFTSIVSWILALSHLLVVPATPSYGNDLANTVSCRYLSECSSKLTYRQFYSQQLFEEIKERVSYRGELVVAFGFHPAVLTYNGFFTADGYHNAYAREYKKEFRELIRPTLDASARYANYFDNWGGRAYLFSPEAGYQPTISVPSDVVRLPVDPEQLREMGIRYIISFYRFGQDSKEVLKQVGVFSTNESPYTVFVYEVQRASK